MASLHAALPPSIEVYDVHANRLSGQLPIPSLAPASNLTLLDIRGNALAGRLPDSLFLPSLEVLALDDNTGLGGPLSALSTPKWPPRLRVLSARWAG